MQHIYATQASVSVGVKPCLALRRPTAITCRVSRRNVAVAYSDGHDDVALEGPIRRAFLSIGVSNDDWKRATRLDQGIVDYKPDRVHAMVDLLLDAGLTGSDIAQILLAYPQVGLSDTRLRAKSASPRLLTPRLLSKRHALPTHTTRTLSIRYICANSCNCVKVVGTSAGQMSSQAGHTPSRHPTTYTPPWHTPNNASGVAIFGS